MLPFTARCERGHITLGTGSLTSGIRLSRAMIAIVPARNTVTETAFGTRVNKGMLVALGCNGGDIPFNTVIARKRGGGNDVITRGNRICLAKLPRSKGLRIS